MMFVVTLSPSSSAWLLRSSGASPMPAGHGRLHRAGPQPLAVDLHGAASLLRAPKTVSRISERPAPTSPARPSDLARRAR